MKVTITLEIIPSGINGWDLSKSKKIRFKNNSRAECFARYYTKKVDCLIRWYSWGVWMATYCNGKEVWNCY